MRAILAFCLLLPAAALAVQPGSPAPSLEATQLGAQKAVSLKALQGQVVYVDFWASWCVPCRLSMPALDSLYKKNSSRGFTVIGVNKDTSPADAEKFMKRLPVSFPLVPDSKDAIAKSFDVKAMPSGYLIDRKGKVRKVHRGFTEDTAATLEREIEDLLKEPA
jgi:peroxiredoxin